MTKTALVTGSTSGIGKAFATKLASEKHDLILVSRDADKLSAQSSELSKEYGIKATYITLDLTENNAAQKVFDAVNNQGLSVHILINNAGFNSVGDFIHTDLQKERDMINLHATFTTEMMKYFLPDMVSNGFGRVLNLGSTGSYTPCPHDAVYAATKAYILSVSKGINAELNGTGVSVTALCPGATNTEFARKAGIDKSLLFSLFVMEPDTVANIGYKAMMKGKSAVIAGLYNKLQVFSTKIMPSFITIPVTKKMLKV